MLSMCAVGMDECVWPFLFCVWTTYSLLPRLSEDGQLKWVFYCHILKVFLLFRFSFLLLYSQCFSRYVLWPSSGVCWTWETTQNFNLFNPQGSLVQIPLTINRYKCLVFLYCYSPTPMTDHIWKEKGKPSAFIG